MNKNYFLLSLICIVILQNILLGQKQYNEALAVLDLMLKNKKTKLYALKEKEKVVNILNRK